MKTFLFLFACVLLLAWMTGPTWCPSAGLGVSEAPICHGSEK